MALDVSDDSQMIHGMRRLRYAPRLYALEGPPTTCKLAGVFCWGCEAGCDGHSKDQNLFGLLSTHVAL